MPEQRLQITINNTELYKTIMSISKSQRGQFVTMALDAFIHTDEGQYLVNQFAKHKPDSSKVIVDAPTKNRVNPRDNETAGNDNITKQSVMGDFE